ncbi:MAG: hypothetical protein Q4G07_11285 [Oscillospiraceae bacterium]|nr:hypothetical protein [Oscillospiraceae bacterium]
MSETPVQAEMTAGTFKGALFGFSRKQVLAYIEDMIAENAGQQQKAEATVKSLQVQLQQNSQRFAAEKQELSDAVRAGEDKMEALRAELNAAGATNAELQEKIAKINEECNSFRSRLFAKEQEYLQMKNRAGRLEEQNAELVRRVTDTKEELESLRQKYDEKAQEEQRRGEVYAAQQRELQEQAERSRLKAQQEARALYEAARQKAEEEKKSICGEISGLGGCVTTLREELDGLQAQIEEATGQFQNVMKELRTSFAAIDEKVQAAGRQAEKEPPKIKTPPPQAEPVKDWEKEEPTKTASARILDALIRLLG